MRCKAFLIREVFLAAKDSSHGYGLKLTFLEEQDEVWMNSSGVTTVGQGDSYPPLFRVQHSNSSTSPQYSLPEPTINFASARNSLQASCRQHS